MFILIYKVSKSGPMLQIKRINQGYLFFKKTTTTTKKKKKTKKKQNKKKKKKKKKNRYSDPSLEPSHGDGSSQGSQCMFSLRSKEISLSIIPVTLSYLEYCRTIQFTSYLQIKKKITP